MNEQPTLVYQWQADLPGLLHWDVPELTKDIEADIHDFFSVQSFNEEHVQWLTQEVCTLLRQCFFTSGSRLVCIGPTKSTPARTLLILVYPSHTDGAYCHLLDGRTKELPKPSWRTEAIDIPSLIQPLADPEEIDQLADVEEIGGVDIDACLHTFIGGFWKILSQPKVRISLQPFISPDRARTIIDEFCEDVLPPFCDRFQDREDLALIFFQLMQHGESLKIAQPVESISMAARIRRIRYQHQAKCFYGPLLTVLGVSPRPQAIAYLGAATPQDERRRQLLSDIAQGRAFLGDLARELDVPAWVLRHITQLNADGVLAYSCLHGGNLIADLSRLRPINAPDNGRELERMSYVLHELPTRVPMVKAAILDRQYTIEDSRAFEWLMEENNLTLFSNYLRFIGILFDQLSINSGFKRTRSIEALIGNPSLGEWVLLCRRWQELFGNDLREGIKEPRFKPMRDLAWPALLIEPVTVKGITFRSLASHSALLQAGLSLRKGLAYRSLDCAHGVTSILALESKGAIIGTAVIDILDYGSKPRLIINQANRGIVDLLFREEREALEQLIECLNRREIAINPAFLDDTVWDTVPEQRLEQVAIALIDSHFGGVPGQGLGQSPGQNLGHMGKTLRQRINLLPDIFLPGRVEDFKPCLEISPGRGQLYQAVSELMNRAVSFR